MPDGDVRLIPLGDGFYAYVDATDYEWLSRWTWHVYGDGYAGRGEKGKLIAMHREIMKPPKGMLVDHADGSRANNCRCNLRVCTYAENQRNKRKQHGARSRFKGVTYSKRYDKWCAHCRAQGEPCHIGYYDEEVDAARAYDRAAVAWFGEFARPNFPEEWPPERRARVYAEAQAEREALIAKAPRKKKQKAKAKQAKSKNKKSGTKRATKKVKKTKPHAEARGRRVQKRKKVRRSERKKGRSKTTGKAGGVPKNARKVGLAPPSS